MILSMFSTFLLGCHHKKIGVIDIIDNGICAIQFDDTTTIQVSVSKCKNLREGDTVRILMENK